MGNILSCCFCKSWCKTSEEPTIENIVLNYSLNNVNLDVNDRKRTDEVLVHQLYENDCMKSEESTPKNTVLNCSLENVNLNENERKGMDDLSGHQLYENECEKSEGSTPENIGLNFSLKNVNLDENELKRMDGFLVHQLYEKEIKQKRSDEELQCITKAVKNIVAKLMTAVCNQNSIFEISDQYLVGSMAEGTSIREPDEFDFLVVLKYFSNPGAVLFHKVVPVSSGLNMFNNDFVLASSEFNIEYNFLTKIMKSEIKLLGSVVEKSNHGALSIQSTTVCHHGPASVIKLVWKPTVTHSRELDILVDITPCIEQKGIDSVIKASELPSTQMYNYLKEHDTYMMTRCPGMKSLFQVSFTTLEVETVKELSHNHKLCYMILKYCLNNIAYHNNYNPFPSFCIKTFVIMHARQCTNIVPDDKEATLSVFTCIMDVFNDIGKSVHVYTFKVGIFLRYHFPFMCDDNILTFFDKIIHALLQLGLNGYSVARDSEFTEACNLESIDSRVQQGAEYLLKHDIKCHLPSRCRLH